MNEAFYVDFEFNESLNKKIDTIGAVNTFFDYVSKSAEPGDEKLMEHSIKLLENVANAYKKDKELNIIDSIRTKLSGLTYAKAV